MLYYDHDDSYESNFLNFWRDGIRTCKISGFAQSNIIMQANATSDSTIILRIRT